MVLAYVICGIIGAALTLVLHEFSHCLVVWNVEGKVVEFKPWPHIHDGRFYFGRMSYEVSEPLPEKTMAIAPLFKAYFMLLLWVALGFSLYHPLLVLAAWELTDIGNWLQGFIRKGENDGGIFRRSDE